MMRLKTIVIAFLLIIQPLEEEHILVYAHEGEDTGHKSVDYLGDKDSSTLNPKDLSDFTITGAPRKLRSGRTTRDEKNQVIETNNDNWSFMISIASRHLMVERKLGFPKRREHKKTNNLADHDTTKHAFSKRISLDHITNENSLQELEPSISANYLRKLVRLLRDDYPIRGKPRRKPPINIQAPNKS
ncbi:Protein GOLVEN 3 [Cardamine amara subsp. amara]|uniref:Protein GOLVEN 3 n=1 Tax=Cardamine amara subsp. amara TaxID=228776 RepID=A0ABD1A846_CARAN